MYKGKYISELTIDEVRKYFGLLRLTKPFCPTLEEQADYKMCEERLIVYACKVIDESLTAESEDT